MMRVETTTKIELDWDRAYALKKLIGQITEQGWNNFDFDLTKEQVNWIFEVFEALPDVEIN